MSVVILERLDAPAAPKGAETSGYAVNWDTASERYKNLHEFLYSSPQVMDPHRLRCLLDVYEEFAGESVPFIRAKLFERFLLTKGIFLDGNPIVGTLSGIRCGVNPYPEWNVDWIKDEMQLAKMTSLGEMKIPEETLRLLEEVYKKWKNRTVIALNNKYYKERYGVNPSIYHRAGVYYENASVATGGGVADYARVLNVGLRGIIDEIKEHLANCPTSLDNRDKIELYRAMIVAAEAVIAYAHRYADLAEKTAEETADEKEKAELLEIAEVCRRVPEYPARNFREAIQSFWFTHLAIETEQMSCGNSPGRYGKYMYPFYKKDIEEGRLNDEQVINLLMFQWIKHMELAEYQGGAYAKSFSGHTGQTISIGGVDADGKDASNEFEELLLETQIRVRGIQPTLTLFYHPKMKRSILEKAVECIRGGSGQPQILNNDIAIQRNLARFAKYPDGISIEDARNTANFGCVSTGICGKGSFVNQENHPCLAKIVEITLNNGKDPRSKKLIGCETGDPREFSNFEELYAAVMKQLKHMFVISRNHSQLGEIARVNVAPGVFRPILYEGCIERGLLEETGGPIYHQTAIILTGGIDAANSLLAIKHLVYDTKKLSMDQLLEALKANFAGHEDIRRMCFEAPKHGNDDPEVEKIVQRFYYDVDHIHKSLGKDSVNVEPILEAFSLSYHNYFGALMGALPTGRKAGVALTDGSVSAMPGTDREGITALIKSAAETIDTVRYGSNHFNVKLLPSFLNSAQSTNILFSLIKTYFDYGGSHIQFNCVSSDTLQDAQDNPEDYKNLVVRVAGFSAYFTRLDRGVQNEIIKRTEYAH